MSGKSVNFDNKKLRRSGFYKNKKVFQIDNIDANKMFLKKNHVVHKIDLNTLLDTVIMMLLLDRYV